ncbi:MAG TPA: hypothetical protein DGG94_01870 [Micromonosporaceae bacterium]|nr:hypothetical protein [Micromonosporaceae bacterium]HCU48575.1 hypothetical protein [Micromonosporaceae bacterium]
MLSEDEQKELDRIEQEFTQADPKLAARLSKPSWLWRHRPFGGFWLFLTSVLAWIAVTVVFGWRIAVVALLGSLLALTIGSLIQQLRRN